MPSQRDRSSARSGANGLGAANDAGRLKRRGAEYRNRSTWAIIRSPTPSALTGLPVTEEMPTRGR